MKKDLVYAGLVYMGNEKEEYEKIVEKKYGKNAELRNYSYDDIWSLCKYEHYILGICRGFRDIIYGFKDYVFDCDNFFYIRGS